jgi:hypothetical protein
VYANLVISAHFKPISGREDQAAGIIFRVQDQDNYYILRANALEGNTNLYKYVGGRRSILKEGSAKVGQKLCVCAGRCQCCIQVLPALPHKPGPLPSTSGRR